MIQNATGFAQPVERRHSWALLPRVNGRDFPETSWSLVAGAGRPDGRLALSQLCERYWDPVYFFLRGLRLTEQEAREHTQGFFASLLERNSFAQVDPNVGGRFRSWLRTSAKNYLRNQWRRANAEIYGGGFEHVSVDDEAGLQLQAEQLDADEQFDRVWARTLVERAFRRLRAEYAESEHKTLVQQLLDEAGARPIDATVASALGVAEGTLRVRRSRLKDDMKRSFARYLRSEIADTVVRPSDIDAEYEALVDLLP